MTWYGLLLFFVLATTADWLSVKWHEQRFAGHRTRAAAIAGMLEVLSWLPIYVAIKEDSVSILVVSVVGSMLGSWIGIRRKVVKDV